jgi:hypothetical protein
MQERDANGRYNFLLPATISTNVAEAPHHYSKASGDICCAFSEFGLAP